MSRKKKVDKQGKQQKTTINRQNEAVNFKNIIEREKS